MKATQRMEELARQVMDVDGVLSPEAEEDARYALIEMLKEST